MTEEEYKLEIEKLQEKISNLEYTIKMLQWRIKILEEEKKQNITDTWFKKR